MAYTGPGDIYSFTGWWGLRAYSAAAAAGTVNCIDIVDQAGANPLTVKVLTNGDLDQASIATWVTAHTVTTIFVRTIYDQVSTNNLVNGGTASQSGSLTLNTLNSGTLPKLTTNPAALYTGGTSFGAPGAQPFTLIALGKRNSFIPGDGNNFFIENNNGHGIAWDAVSGQLAVNCGTGATFSSFTENAFHRIQAMCNGASSKAYVDAGAFNSTINPGTGDFSGAPTVGNQFDSVTQDVLEIGFIESDQSANFAAMDTNQNNYWFVTHTPAAGPTSGIIGLASAEW